MIGCHTEASEIVTGNCLGSSTSASPKGRLATRSHTATLGQWTQRFRLRQRKKKYKLVQCSNRGSGKLAALVQRLPKEASTPRAREYSPTLAGPLGPRERHARARLREEKGKRTGEK